MKRASFLLLALAFMLVATSASAQGLDDVPRPEELAGEDGAAKPLRIDWPANGDRVKTPFTITGVAAPGARLELWLGDQLERVFLADANGRFNTAVARQSEGEITIYQVDNKGQRIQSTTVAVTWSGAATPLGPQEVGDPDVSTADAAELDPFGKQTRTSTGLPRVSQGDATSGEPPVPPNPGQFEEANVASQGEPEVGGSENVVRLNERPKPSPGRGVRTIAEAGGGIAGALVIGFGGLLIGGTIGFIADGGTAYLGTVIFGGLGAITGMAVGLPIGVVLTGNLLDGNGKWYAVVLGELIGFGLGAGLTSACYGCAGGVMTLFALPVVGAVMGYELTSDNAARARGVQSMRPTMTRRQDGGYSFGLGLSF